MSCLRISRLLLGGATLLLLLLGAGCKDDLPAPFDAEVHLRFESQVEGLGTGAKVFVDDELVIDSLSTSQVTVRLAAGTHRVRIHKDCVQVAPSDLVTVEVVAGEPQVVTFRLSEQAGVLVVLSTPPGLPVWIDGTATGQITPASYPCLEPGAHQVSIPTGSLERTGFLVEGLAEKEATVGAQGRTEVSFTFSYQALPQARGVLLELFTATYCPNCPITDAAADVIEFDPEFEPELFSACQLHVWWGGSDPLFFSRIGERVVFYGLDDSAPHAIFNGEARLSGSNYPDVVGTYKQRIRQTYAQPAEVGLYWEGVGIAGGRLEGRLRYVAIADLTGYVRPVLQVFYTKDGIVAQNPFNVPEFNGVVRQYREPLDLREAGLLASNATVEIPVGFDLAADERWATRSVRLIAFVQEQDPPRSRVVLQTREARIDLP